MINHRVCKQSNIKGVTSLAGNVTLPGHLSLPPCLMGFVLFLLIIVLSDCYAWWLSLWNFHNQLLLMICVLIRTYLGIYEGSKYLYIGQPFIPLKLIVKLSLHTPANSFPYNILMTHDTTSKYVNRETHSVH
jgi:hypothetical protein